MSMLVTLKKTENIGSHNIHKPEISLILTLATPEVIVREAKEIKRKE